ncbi:tetratricopeptide repeat-containing sensor histidine kinase [Niabella drilacis]|uniref:histidine kinase n=1 Tax=Niabella drilacis (strain DSM 25811 / CCM 8410 / CCUG 62505 / LMG 26954 / E90) TaxID=1285928 RepID=A0A1G6Z3H9_NIADE|nr:tetratricopeptide repeat-containing sensor histidine kinase [Niabella drilacis]SDD97091.1 Signal transduction histidine kinase [Niabella drilacis]
MKRNVVLYTTALMGLLLFAFDGRTQEVKTKEQLLRISLACDSLNRVEEYGKAQALARQTLAVIPSGDNTNLSLFNFYIGVGYQGVLSDSAIFYYQRSLTYAHLAENSKRISNALLELMYLYNYTDGYTTERDKTAAALNRMIDTTSSVSLKKACYIKLADYYRVIGWREQELNYRLQSLGLMKTEMQQGLYKDGDADSVNIGVAYFNIGDLYETMDHYTKAQEFYRQARPLLWNYKAGICAYYKGMATSYLKMGNTVSARQYEDSLENMVAHHYKIADGWSTLISTYLSNAEYYLDRENAAAAMPYLVMAEKLIGTKVQDAIETGSFNYTMGRALSVQKNYVKALPYLIRAEAVRQGFSADLYAKVLRALAACYEGLGKWQEADLYYAKYLPLRDSLDARAAQQSMANAEARFQNKEKVKEIEAQKAQISFARQQRLWLVAGIVALVLLAGLLLLFYRNKKRNADLLVRLNSALEEANRTKAKLFGIISHDLRSPMNQVYQFLRLQQLNPGALDENQKAALSSKIQNATGSLLETMEDLLLWSKTQMNAFEAQLQPVNIAAVVMDCQRLLQLNSEARKIVFETGIPEDLTVQTDANYLQTIVRNLLQNAIKAAPGGSLIQIEAKQENGRTWLLVKNQGAAFTQEQYERLIRQEQHAASLSGLGLKLVDELSRKIHATVSFHYDGTYTRACLEF